MGVCVKELVQRWINRIERGLTFFTAFCMGILSVLVSWQVFARYVLRDSPYWVEEIVVTGMMWVGLLGAAACVWTGVPHEPGTGSENAFLSGSKSLWRSSSIWG